MKPISIFKKFNQVFQNCTLEEIVARIRGEEFAEPIKRIREFLHHEEEEKAQRLKKQLLAFTPSGHFERGRKLKSLKAYHPLIVLDVDKLPGEMKTWINKVKRIPYTKACFISPSGRGLKILIATDAEQGFHAFAFQTIAKYYEESLGIDIDKSGKDITRLCFFSHDPHIFYRSDSEIFSIQGKSENTIEHTPAFEECIAFTQQKSTYVNGNRNNFLFLLASNCNRAGLAQSETLSQILAQYDLPPDEIQRSVASAYKRDPDSFKKLISTPSQSIKPKKAQTPFLPDQLFTNLPTILGKGCATFEDKRERDVFLTGALTVLSACLPNVSGVYDRRVCHPNLFSFVIAPAASGKGALVFAKELGFAYHQALVKESKQSQKTFQQDLQRYELSVLRYRKGKLLDPPQKPEEKNFRLLYIPANSSSAMLIRHLQQCGGSGMLFETEADTLSNVLKQDWGGYSDLLRKVFHHEPIAYSRKLNNDFLEIEYPRLSVALSGTPKQVTRLIPSVEDGLFSRFLFYVYEVDTVWRDVSPQHFENGTGSIYRALAQEIFQMVAFLEKHPTNFVLQDHQWYQMNIRFSEQLKEIKALLGTEALSIVKRLGLIFFRLAMILSACRKYEAKDTAKEISCNDQDFLLAMSMVEVYLEHALYLFDHLPQKSRTTFQQLPANKRAFYQALPSQFRRKDAHAIGQQLNLSAATIDRFLKQLNGTMLQQPEYGVYQKIANDKPQT